MNKLVEIQRDFSERAFPEFWRISDRRDLVLRVEYLSNALAGEAGELANVVKKIVRREVYGGPGEPLEGAVDKVEEELTDVFIYVMTMAALLGIDLEKAYFRKLKANEERFLRPSR